MKRYAPLAILNDATTWCPLYIAWQVLDEARDYFRTEFRNVTRNNWPNARNGFCGESFLATAVSPGQWSGELLASMRALAGGVLAQEKPARCSARYRKLQAGQPLPDHPSLRHWRKKSRQPVPLTLPRFFVHGWYLLGR